MAAFKGFCRFYLNMSDPVITVRCGNFFSLVGYAVTTPPTFLHGGEVRGFRALANRCAAGSDWVDSRLPGSIFAMF